MPCPCILISGICIFTLDSCRFNFRLLNFGLFKYGSLNRGSDNLSTVNSSKVNLVIVDLVIADLCIFNLDTFQLGISLGTKFNKKARQLPAGLFDLLLKLLFSCCMCHIRQHRVCCFSTSGFAAFIDNQIIACCSNTTNLCDCSACTCWYQTSNSKA